MGRVLLWSAAALSLGADQATKWWIQQNMRLFESRPLGDVFPLNQLAITYTYNTGAAFGILANYGQLFVAVAVIVVLGIIFYQHRLPQEQRWLFVSFGFQLGGALGNLVDRLRLGHVVDFIHIWNLPIFNLADVSIVTGTLMLAWYLWHEEDPGSGGHPEKRSPSTSRPHRPHGVVERPAVYEE
ncbi:MAG: signal peptidase II [Ardenticatenia bacterium]|nr:signal peptidase II [Ardenticatenia bacterium]